MAQTKILLRVRDYDLAATLDSGQVFRWREHNGSWIGVVGKRWVRLTQTRAGIRAETEVPVSDWKWLHDYLQSDVELAAMLKTFPDDKPMRDAVAACHGLRILRQDPWECLVSFILSSTKQIVQIRQIIALLCERFGEPVDGFQVGRVTPCAPWWGNYTSSIAIGGALGTARPTSLQFSFPTAERLAVTTEAELRACKMGFRAPHLLAAARRIADGKFDLKRLHRLPLVEARAELVKLHGVGDKIADCVLLFAYGFDSAFPVDVWIGCALRELYFPRRHVTAKQLQGFAATHFGPHSGYAQQYLFHYMRTKVK